MPSPNALQDAANDLAPYLEHTDTAAIHVDVADEITQITLKAAPAIDDVFVIEDASDSAEKKSCTLGAMLKAPGWISNLDAKAVPVAADSVVINDSADSDAPKESTLTQVFGAAALISGQTAKATPIGADLVWINDSASSNASRKATINTLPILQAQVTGVLLVPAADAAVAILNTTAGIQLTVTAAGNVAITTSSSYAGQRIHLFAVAVAGGGSYTLALNTGTLTLNATGESAVIMRDSGNANWYCVGLSGATIV